MDTVHGYLLFDGDLNLFNDKLSFILMSVELKQIKIKKINWIEADRTSISSHTPSLTEIEFGVLLALVTRLILRFISCLTIRKMVNISITDVLISVYIDSMFAFTDFL